MDIEELALKMRNRAIKIAEDEARNGNLKEKQQKLLEQRKIENLQKLYFHAGRWAGGARDKTAKAAFQRVSIGA
jgi:hypothetical protein